MDQNGGIKKILRFAFEGLSFLLLITLVFLGSVIRVAKINFFGSNETKKGESLNRISFNYALADVPDNGGGGGGGPFNDVGCSGGTGDGGPGDGC